MAAETISTTGSLEENSLWYRYKTEVWSQTSEQERTVHNIMRVLRGIRNFGDLAYVSVPITSGRFMYGQRLEKPSVEARDLLEEAISHNYAQGWEFIEELQKRRDCPIVYPADLVPAHHRWENSHFQSLWLSVIGEKCTEVHMGNGWEYSNGAVEEFVHTMQLRLGIPRHPDFVFYNTKEDEQKERERMRNIRVYDHLGNQIAIESGIDTIEDSIDWIQGNGFDARRLNTSHDLLVWTKQMIDAGFYQ